MVNDGGPAFPGDSVEGESCHHKGMSLRDYFAGQTINALLSNESWLQRTGDTARSLNQTTSAVAAQIAYEVADAMLTRRLGQPTKQGQV